MPFCPSCGYQFNSGEKFCMQCGKPINENRKIVPIKETRVNSIRQQGQIRGESISEVVRMINYFSIKQRQYDEYDYCEEKIEHFTKPLGAATVVWGVILTILGGYIFIVSGVMILLGRKNEIEPFFAEKNNLPAIVAFLVFLLFGLVLIITRIIKVIVRKNKVKKYISRESELAMELTDYYNNYGPCIVGAEYTNPRVLDVIGQTLRSGRADTIKEAINVILDDAHKTQMQLQAQLTAQAARQAANGAQTAAAFSAARFFIGGLRLFL